MMASTNPLWHWDDDDLALDAEALDLPPAPRQRRCGALHDGGTGPWIGTMACCTRPIDHNDGHTMSLGDPGSPSFWQESWE